MRKKLAEQAEERKTFRAVLSRFGKKTNYNGYSEDTLLFTQVVDVVLKQVVADHVWFTFSKAFESLSLRPGDVIEFDARIKAYQKGYINKSLGFSSKKKDFKLSHPTKLKKIVE